MIRLWSSREPSPSGVVAQLLQEIREQLGVIHIDLGLLRDQLRIVAMMRDGVMLLRHADERDTCAELSSRAMTMLNTRVDVGAKRQHLEIEHQLGVRFEGVRDVEWGAPASSTDCAPCVSVFWIRCSISRTESMYSAELGAVARAQSSRQPVHFLGNGIQNAAGALGQREPLRRRCRRRRTAVRRPRAGGIRPRLGVVSLRQETVLT